jgi:hypothetical protein
MRFKNMFFRELKSILILAAPFILVACGDSAQQKPDKKVQATVPQPEINAALLTAQVSSAPVFDTQGRWGAGYLKAKGKGPGVVVGPGGDNPNVFAQQFPVKPGDQFKLVARASSVDSPAAKGRFQINWMTASSFISASIKPFDVSPEEKQFEHFVTAPSGAVLGVLYVVADGPDNVVRYTEMRLLGKEPVAPAK